jgi:YD repeat-containing protein
MKGLRRKTLFIEKPEGRFLDIRYFESKDPSRDGKVGCLIEPLGPNGESIKSYQFHYEKDFTEVLDALGNCKRYHFDKNQRLTSIHHVEKSRGHTHSLREEKYAWSTREGQEGWLRAKSIKHGNQYYHLKTYRYDSRGNIIMTTLYGNLTGEKPESFENTLETDSYRIQYVYTDDARNLLIEKRTPEGCTTRYEYLDGTNLCTKILESYDGKIQERIFHAYDDNGQIAMTIEDDGSALNEPDLTDITVRKITHIECVKHSGPSFGKPAQKSEFYINPHTGQTLLIKRTEYFYDEKGREIKQRVHDANNAFVYETTQEFDERGNLIRKSNALGHVTKYRYDKNNNKIYEKTSGSGKTIYFEYNLANRLVLKRERHHKGETFITTYAYNGLSELISETDSYGHATTYSYDRYGNQLQCVKPLMQDVHDTLLHPTLTKSYNLLNQVISETNENGHTKQYTYNAYGSPTQIIHPDGATERFTYYPNGKLRQQWKADGTSIHYTVDPKGRVIKESSFDQNNALLKEEHFHYKR